MAERRIVAARINHETNTFSPLATPLAAFSPLWGAEALQAASASATALSAFADFVLRRGAVLDVPVLAMANPSGRVDDDAFEAMATAVCDAVRAGPCAAVLLDLHGAMVTRSHDEADAELVARVRTIAPDVPIGVALDLHGNVSPRLVAAADVVIGFKTYPHVDMRETGEAVARIVGRMLDDGLRPHGAVVQVPVLAQTLCMNTETPGAMADLIAEARAAETKAGVLAATIFGGFSLADTPAAGASVVVIAETAGIARARADALGAALWEKRAGLVFRERPLAASIAAALAVPEGPGPVLLLDHGDNCMSGGTCDVMDVLAAALDAGLTGVLAGPISDPEAVAAMTQAGVGAAVTLGIGNKVALPGFSPQPPLTLEGRVAALGEGAYTITGPTYTGMRCTMGRAAVLDTGRARVLVTERPHEPWDVGVFTCVGLAPESARWLILKSRMYCRPVFEPMSRAVIECASRGVTSSNNALFAFRKLRRPIYPLNDGAGWGRA